MQAHAAFGLLVPLTVLPSVDAADPSRQRTLLLPDPLGSHIPIPDERNCWALGIPIGATVLICFPFSLLKEMN